MFLPGSNEFSELSQTEDVLTLNLVSNLQRLYICYNKLTIF